ncbi:MAG: NUDIX hydrolase [Candidatus Saccharimonadaceae bacterium]
MTMPITQLIAKVLVINEKNEALILTVGDYKARPDKSFKPDLPGGLVDPGETELEAVVRELKEETGIIASHNEFQLAYTKTEFFLNENKSVIRFLYLIYLDSSPEVSISWEHVSYQWAPLDGLLESTELRPFYKEAVEYCFTNKLVKTAS